MKSSRELKMALFDASKMRSSESTTNFMMMLPPGEFNLPVGEIRLNHENAKLVSDSARKLGITPEEFVNNLIQVDLNIAREFNGLRKEIKDLIK